MDAVAPLPSDPYLYFGNMDPKSQQHQIPNFVGLALKPHHAREIEHNALKPLPFADGAIRKIQSEDVFEHLPRDAIPGVLNEVYRVLALGGVFRLSMPDCNPYPPNDMYVGRAPPFDMRAQGKPISIIVDFVR